MSILLQYMEGPNQYVRINDTVYTVEYSIVTTNKRG